MYIPYVFGWNKIVVSYKIMLLDGVIWAFGIKTP